MEPTLAPRDVLVVEKLTPALEKLTPALARSLAPRTPRTPLAPRDGEIVLFRPPGALRDVVARAGGALGERDLFVKRVARVAGERVEPDGGGSRAGARCDEPEAVVQPRAQWVLGDNPGAAPTRACGSSVECGMKLASSTKNRP